jgi:hypothetical protein
MFSFKVSGSPTNDDMNAFVKSIEPKTKALQSLYEKMNTDENKDLFESQIKKLDYELKETADIYIKNNPKKSWSLLMISGKFNYRDSIEDIESLYHSLDNEYSFEYLSYQEDKNFNSQRANVRRSAAKYSTDASVGTINTFAPYKNQLEDLTNQFVKFSDGISPKFRLSTAYNAMTADQKDYFSNLSQETINNAFEDLDELNKLTTELQRTILLLKSQTLTLDGVYPSSKYR